tara:strand:+ start:14944 stop:16242 length:1299 start_codon:yes stop_codon:yes gene_type:complete
MAKLNIKPRVKNLYSWLEYIDRIHPSNIEMSLGRLNQVKTNLNFSLSFPIITVSGTNGKGSVCAILESILSQAGYLVGCYTSPHLLRYNERIRIGKKEVNDDELCKAFNIIEAARVESGASLTYFEFSTLVAMELIAKARVDVAILEVGLGGRLDAVNIFDADCAVLTNIDYDHEEYLGNTREEIGLEKAGIFRRGRAAICSDISPPISIRKHAISVGAELKVIGEQFNYFDEGYSWNYCENNYYYSLPYPSLGNTSCQLRNASASLATLNVFKDIFPVTDNDIKSGLLNIQLSGRFQIISDKPKVIFDVAHNPSAIHALKNSLAGMVGHHKTYAVFSALKDKDISEMVQRVASEIDYWLVTGINSTRGLSSNEIVESLEKVGIKDILSFSDAISAYIFACKQASLNDRICVFGSFHVVGEIMEFLNKEENL